MRQVVPTALELGHPTRERLISIVAELLETHSRAEITSSQVIDLSGVSPSSLYHHFSNFADLLETAEIRRFSRQIDESIAVFTTTLRSARSGSQFRTRLKELLGVAQGDGDEERRRDHGIAPLTAVESYQHMRDTIGLHQQRLTDALTELFEHAHDKGWVHLESPQAAAVLFQSFTMGKILDDVSVRRMDHAAWDLLLGQTIDQVFGPA